MSLVLESASFFKNSRYFIIYNMITYFNSKSMSTIFVETHCFSPFLKNRHTALPFGAVDVEQTRENILVFSVLAYRTPEKQNKVMP